MSVEEVSRSINQGKRTFLTLNEPTLWTGVPGWIIRGKGKRKLSTHSLTKEAIGAAASHSCYHSRNTFPTLMNYRGLQIMNKELCYIHITYTIVSLELGLYVNSKYSYVYLPINKSNKNVLPLKNNNKNRYGGICQQFQHLEG